MMRSEGEGRRTSPGFELLMSPPALLGVAASVLTLLLGIWSRSAMPDPRNVPFISGDSRLLYGVGVAVAVGLGIAAVLLARMRMRVEASSEWSSRYTTPSGIETRWILPALTMLGAFLLVARYHRGQDIAAAMLLAGSGVFAAVTVRESLTTDDVSPRAPARMSHLILTTGIAFVVFALILLYRTRTLYAGPLTFTVGFLLLLQAQDRIASFPIRRVAYALVGAIAIAQATWALTSWPPSGWWTGGVLASIVLGYALISGAQLAGRLSRDLAINSVGVTTVIAVACAYLAR